MIVKKLKYDVRPYFYWKKLKEQGVVIELPMGVFGQKEPSNAREIRNFFDHYIAEDNDTEDIVDNLNYLVEIEEGDNKFDTPIGEGTHEYVLLFDDKVEVYLVVTDEYHGCGEYSFYLEVTGIYIKEDVSNEYLNEIKQWLRDAFEI